MAEYIGVTEAAKLTGYSAVWLKELARTGTVEAFKLHPRAWALNKADLLAYAAKQKARKGRKDGK